MPKTLDANVRIGDIQHQWIVREYDQHDRGVLWHVGMITVGIILVLYGLIFNNFLFSLIIILFAIILFLQSYQTPPEVQFAITDTGIVVGNKLYTFSEFEQFYIVYNPPQVKMLFLDTKSPFRPLLRVPLQDMNPVAVRHTLREYLNEDFEKEEEPLSDAFARNWKIH
jgi:hypothetical protein